MDNFTAHWVAIATPALLLGVVAAVWVFRFLRRRRNQVSFRHLRGRSLRTAQQVEEALANTPPNQGIRLGQYLLPQRVAYGHFAIVGTTPPQQSRDRPLGIATLRGQRVSGKPAFAQS